MLVTQSCPTLYDPMDCSLPGFSVHGIFQARKLEWVAISFSRESSWRFNLQALNLVSCIADRFLTIWATRGVPFICYPFTVEDLFWWVPGSMLKQRPGMELYSLHARDQVKSSVCIISTYLISIAHLWISAPFLREETKGSLERLHCPKAVAKISLWSVL